MGCIASREAHRTVLLGPTGVTARSCPGDAARQSVEQAVRGSGLLQFQPGGVRLARRHRGCQPGGGAPHAIRVRRQRPLHGNTHDPAGVSRPIRTLIDRDQAVTRIRRAAALMEQALEADDEEEIREALAKLFPDYVPAPGAPASKAKLVDALRRANAGLT